MDPDFPLVEWDRLLPREVITLNLLRASRVNSKLSKYAYIFGEFKYNATPIAPPGTWVLAHAKPSKQSTWAPNGDNRWYVGPLLDHYKCVNVYLPSTRAKRNYDTVTFIPVVVPLPQVKADDFLKQAALDIISILTNPLSTTAITLAAGDVTQNALLKIAHELKQVEQLPSLPNEQPTNKLNERKGRNTESPKVTDNHYYTQIRGWLLK